MQIDEDSFKMRMSFFRNLIHSGNSKGALSQFEVELSRRKQDLLDINDECEFGILSLMQKLNGLVKPHEIVKFLLDIKQYTDEKGMEIALDTLSIAAEEKIALTEDDLVEIYKDCASGDIPPILSVNIMGEQKTDEDIQTFNNRNVIQNNRSFLNLEAMKDFR